MEKVLDKEIEKRLAKRKTILKKIAKFHSKIKKLELQEQITKKKSTKADCRKTIRVYQAIIVKLNEESRAA
ncbi:MAG: hypothetical protein KAT77_03705 [Nanoarchaeota archaeon]|nr:hypothetical protein [Nanoarchaeota archaeon]